MRARQLMALATLWQRVSTRGLRGSTRSTSMTAPAPAICMAKLTLWINCNAMPSIPRMANDFTRSTSRGLCLRRDNTGGGWACADLDASCMVVEELNMHLRPVGDFFYSHVLPEGPVVVQTAKTAKLTICSKNKIKNCSLSDLCIGAEKRSRD